MSRQVARILLRSMGCGVVWCGVVVVVVVVVDSASCRKLSLAGSSFLSMVGTMCYFNKSGSLCQFKHSRLESLRCFGSLQRVRVLVKRR